MIIIKQIHYNKITTKAIDLHYRKYSIFQFQVFEMLIKNKECTVEI